MKRLTKLTREELTGIKDLLSDPLENYITAEEQTEENCIEVVSEWGEMLKFVVNPTDKIRLAAVSNDFRALKYIIKPSLEICKEAFKNDIMGDSLYYIAKENRTEEICLEAIRAHAHAISHIDDPTEEMCRLAIQEDYFTIVFVNKPSFELCEFAIQQDPRAISYITNDEFKKKLKKKYNLEEDANINLEKMEF